MDLSHWDCVDEFTIRQTASLIAGHDPRMAATQDTAMAAKIALIQEKLVECVGRCAKHVARYCVPRATGPDLFSILAIDSRHIFTMDLGWAAQELAGLHEHVSAEKPSVDQPEWADELKMIRRRVVSMGKRAIQIDSPQNCFERKTIVFWCRSVSLNPVYRFEIEGQEQRDRLPFIPTPWNTEEAAIPTAASEQWPWGDYETKLLRLLPLVYAEHWKKYDPAKPDTAPKSEAVSSWLNTEHKVPVRVAEVIAQMFRADGLPNGPRRRDK